jgi:hypothetical protein
VTTARPATLPANHRTAHVFVDERLAVATICRMDSRACWGIQLADVLTGAVAHQYRQACDPRVKAGTP